LNGWINPHRVYSVGLLPAIFGSRKMQRVGKMPALRKRRQACAHVAGCIILRALRPVSFSGAAWSGEDE